MGLSRLPKRPSAMSFPLFARSSSGSLSLAVWTTWPPHSRRTREWPPPATSSVSISEPASALVLIGEDPALSSAEPRSLSHLASSPNRTDTDRNCLSNIRDGGLTPESAGPVSSLVLRSLLWRKAYHRYFAEVGSVELKATATCWKLTARSIRGARTSSNQ